MPLFLFVHISVSVYIYIYIPFLYCHRDALISRSLIQILSVYFLVWVVMGLQGLDRSLAVFYGACSALGPLRLFALSLLLSSGLRVTVLTAPPIPLRSVADPALSVYLAGVSASHLSCITPVNVGVY